MNFKGHGVTPLFLSLVLALSACSGGSAESMLKSAKEHISKKESNAAVIQLKNALQKQPANPEARYLLGKVLLETGDPVGAEVELIKAQDLGYSAEEIAPHLAKSLLAQGKIEPLLTRFAKSKLVNPAANAELRAAVALAFAQQGKSDEAKNALQESFAADPNNISAQLLQARMYIHQRQFPAAMAVLDKLVGSAPSNADAWQLKGDALLESGAPSEAALAAYRQAIKVDKKNLQSYVAIIWTEFGKKDIEAARNDIAELAKIFPDHPQTRFFLGMIALEKSDLKAAQEQAQYLLKVTPDSPRTLQLAGVVEFRRNSLIQAESYLKKFIKVAPESMQAASRLMLGQIYNRNGDPAKALNVLQPLLVDDSPYPAAFSLAAEAYMQQGDSAGAQNYFSKAVKSNPKDIRSRTALALAKIAKGGDSGFEELKAISRDDKEITADLALFSSYLNVKRWDAAAQVLETIAKKQPDRPSAENLRGRMEMMRGDRVAARAAFERALKIDPKFYPAVATLASLDQDDKKLDAAIARLKAWIALEPKDLRAQLSVIELQSLSGKPSSEIEEALAKLVKEWPNESGPRLLLIRKLVDRKELKAALTLARDGVIAAPDQPTMLATLSQVEQLNGESNQAVATANKWMALQPNSVQPLLRLAELYVALKDPSAAAQSLTRALAIDERYLPAQRMLIAIEVGRGRVDSARKVIKVVQTQRPNDAIGQVLEAELESTQKNWAGAVAAYQSALNKNPSTDIAIKTHYAYLSGGKTAEGGAFATRWLQKNPSDVAFIYYLGDLALTGKQYAQAEQHYRAVLKLQPENAAALNNVAWLLNLDKKPDALEYAERAVKLQPKQAPLLDTLAEIYASRGQLEKAIEVQKQALSLAPDAHLHRLHLATFYVSAGKKAEAKVELKRLADLGDKFPAQDTVKKLSIGL
ncbi:XrtA/PEP-CTERM system TPR-repeat protein PrsT [Paucibacter sp. KCTC 42545]|uniref:XrtA/PEP-CTERM system TPR-repeat protein PrsT n=1 Tax=Paucibacter sp. KCTC 42545 TaxID=1768242 RepID=UPI000733C205|nr:XrtA/PEP-CTERM system TPR-repeat protein PrsT [Paucibacter sp. KCTC 42545]ALT77291.1 hypothetical protein AT984_08885 [Paucibacter sp. KCTC 42545]